MFTGSYIYDDFKSEYLPFSFLSIAIHSSSSAQAISKFMMPAMSPTMTEGGIASWKVKDGDSFSAGDVLLEIVSRLISL